MINIAICDDEESYRQEIEALVNQSEKAKHIFVEKFSNGKALLNSNRKYDIVILDIELPDGLGVNVANLLRKRNVDLIVIFVTNYTQYISEAFKVMPFQYLTKPIDKKLFLDEINRALKQFYSLKSQVAFSWNKEELCVNIKNIVYLECYSRKIKLKMIDGKEYFTRTSLLQCEEELSIYDFIRIHNGFLLNLRYLNGIDRYTADIANGEKLPISKKYIKELRGKFTSEWHGVRL